MLIFDPDLSMSSDICLFDEMNRMVPKYKHHVFKDKEDIIEKIVKSAILSFDDLLETKIVI